MTFAQQYEDLIVACKLRPQWQIRYKVTHVHHIVPRCMGGSNHADNLVTLTLPEHFEAHRLLALAFPYHAGVVYAFKCMSRDGLLKSGQDYLLWMEKHDRLTQRLIRAKYLASKRPSTKTKTKSKKKSRKRKKRY